MRMSNEHVQYDIDDYPVKSNVGHRELFTAHDYSHAVRILWVLDSDVPENYHGGWGHNTMIEVAYNETIIIISAIMKFAGYHLTQ